MGAEDRESRTTVYLEPIQQTYAVGYISCIGPPENPVVCQKFDGDINASYGSFWLIGNFTRAWAMWSVSSIPNNACITSVKIENYIWPPSDNDHTTQYRRLTTDPRSTSGSTLWGSLANSIYTEFLTGTWDGYRTHTLGGTAKSELEAALTSTNWFAVGITENGDNDGEAVIAGWYQDMPVLIVEYITPPPAPGTPTLTPSTACTGETVTVSWSSVSGATNYRVYRDGGQVCSTGGTSCTVTAPGSPGSYTCTVKAENTCGLSGASPGRTLTVVGPPSIISLTPDSGEPGVTIVTIIGENFWDDPQPGYAVVFTDNAEVPDSACAWTNNQIVLTVPYGALTGPVYVRACTESAPTPFGHWTPVGLVLVAATAPSPDEIHLEWYGESGAGSSYDIFRAEGGYSGEYHLVATVVPEGDGIQVYVDTDVEPSHTYCYMVSASGSGLASASGPLCAETPAFRPESYALLGAAPNPFNPGTTVFFDVPDPGGRVELVLYDISGRKVATLCDNQRDPGRNSVYWGGMMDSGESAASGVYLCRMVAEDFETSCKITMLK